MTGVDVVARSDNCRDRAGSGNESACARPGLVDGKIGRQDWSDGRAADCVSASGCQGAFGLLYSGLFSSEGTGASAQPFSSSTDEADGLAATADIDRLFSVAAALMAGSHLLEAASLLRRLEDLTGSSADSPLWQRRLEFLWAAHSERAADSAAVLDHCRAANHAGASSHAPSSRPESALADGGYLRTLDTTIADELALLAIRAHLRLGQTQAAEAQLESHFGGQDRAEASQPATLAVIAQQQGRLREAERLATGALARAESCGKPPAQVDLDARLVLAEVSLERNELDAAEHQLILALRQCWSSGLTPWVWAVEVELIRVMLARQQAAAALHRVGSLRHAIGTEFVTGPLLSKLNQAEIDAYLGLGELDAALELARTLPVTALPPEVVARVELASGRPDRALARLGAAPGSGLASEVRQLVVRACADRQEGRWQRAEHTVRRAVDMAAADRYVRPFLEAPTLTLPLLHSLASSHSDPYVSHLISQAELLAEPNAPQAAGVLEPLTDRERQVLRHLYSHHSLPQIGAAMHLSTNTIKTHVKSIYRKTGAGSRDEAVTLARSHGLFYMDIPRRDRNTTSRPDLGSPRF